MGPAGRPAAPKPCARRLLEPDPARRRRADARLHRDRRDRPGGGRSAGSACCPSCRARPAGRRGTPATPPLRRATPTDFARFLRALVARYGPNGSLWAEHPEVAAQPVRDWQIWNEPNLTRYWNVAPLGSAPTSRCSSAAHRRSRPPTRGSRRCSPGCRTRAGTRCGAIYDAGGARRVRRRRAAPLHGPAAATWCGSSSSPAARCARRERRHAADLGDRAVVAGREGQDGAATTGFETTEQRPGGAPGRRAARCSRDARRRLRIGRVYWYTWLSHGGRHRQRVRLLRACGACAARRCVERPGAEGLHARWRGGCRAARSGPATHAAAADPNTLERVVRGRERLPGCPGGARCSGGCCGLARRARGLPMLPLGLIFLGRHRPGDGGRAGRGVLGDQRARSGARADRRPPRVRAR